MENLSSEYSKLIFDNLSDNIFYIGVEGEKFRVLSVNPAFYKSTGLTEKQVIGQFVEDVLPPQSREFVLSNYRKAIREKRPVDWHEISDYPTGRRYGDVKLVPLLDKNENCYALLGTVHDVTAIIEAEQRLSTVMERISDAVIALDTNMNYTYLNRRAANLINREPADVLGKHIWTEVSERQNSFSEACQEALTTQKFVEVSDYFAPWNRWFESRIFPSPDGLTIFSTDVTEKVEKELELIEAKSIAEDATKAKSNFLDIAAHELRNPAAATYLMLKALLIQLEKNEEVDSDKILKVLVPVERLNRLLIDLLDTSRLQRNILKLEKKNVDICKLVQDWMAELKLKFPDRVMTFSCPEKSIYLSMDDVRIYQVFTNILENAVKYSPRSSPINVEVKNAPDKVSVYVIDWGDGISEAAIPQIFEPFYRAGIDEKQRYTGLGLGLSIARNLITMHGGTLGVTSVVGKGSTFHFELPKEG